MVTMLCRRRRREREMEGMVGERCKNIFEDFQNLDHMMMMIVDLVGERYFEEFLVIIDLLA